MKLFTIETISKRIEENVTELVIGLVILAIGLPIGFGIGTIGSGKNPITETLHAPFAIGAPLVKEIVQKITSPSHTVLTPTPTSTQEEKKTEGSGNTETASESKEATATPSPTPKATPTSIQPTPTIPPTIAPSVTQTPTETQSPTTQPQNTTDVSLDFNHKGSATPNAQGSGSMHVAKNANGYWDFTISASFSQLQPGRPYKLWLCGVNCSSHTSAYFTTDGSGSGSINGATINHAQGNDPANRILIWEVPPSGEIHEDVTTCYQLSNNSPYCLGMGLSL